jgi:hypothetical protein
MGGSFQVCGDGCALRDDRLQGALPAYFGYETQDWKIKHMAYVGHNPAGELHFAARSRSNDKHSYPSLDLATDGFNIWWEKTFAQHTDMLAQASALMRAHRQVGAVGETHVGQAH